MGAADYESAFTLPLPRRTALNRLNRLRDAGWVDRQGETRATLYSLTEMERQELTVRTGISTSCGETTRRTAFSTRCRCNANTGRVGKMCALVGAGATRLHDTRRAEQLGFWFAGKPRHKQRPWPVSTISRLSNVPDCSSCSRTHWKPMTMR